MARLKSAARACSVELVGSSIEQPQITLSPRTCHFVIRYMGRERRVPYTSMVGLSPELGRKTLDIEARLMGRFANSADYYALERFTPEIYRQYMSSVYRAMEKR